MVRVIQSRLAISLPFSATSAIGIASRDDARYRRSPARSSRVGSSTAPGIVPRAAPLPMSADPATFGSIEPDMDLAGPGGVLVVGEELAASSAVTTADRPQHHQ